MFQLDRSSEVRVQLKVQKEAFVGLDAAPVSTVLAQSQALF